MMEIKVEIGNYINVAAATLSLRSGFFENAGEYLLSVIFGFFISTLLLRFLLQIARADFYNPISQMIVTVTTPMLRPFRRMIPGIGGIDMASIVLLLLLQFTQFLLVYFLKTGQLAWLQAAISAPFHLLLVVTWIYIVAIIILVIASWIASNNYNPVLKLIYQLTNPIMGPIRKIMPAASVIDFSPLVAMVILTLIQMAIPYLLIMVLGFVQ